VADLTVPAGNPLPSQSSAAALVSGDWSAAPMVAAHLVGRAAIIGAGIAFVDAVRGKVDAESAILGGLAGSTLIELFVLIHELTNQARRT
jgi:hypothetical protein